MKKKAGKRFQILSHVCHLPNHHSETVFESLRLSLTRRHSIPFSSIRFHFEFKGATWNKHLIPFCSAFQLHPIFPLLAKVFFFVRF